MAQLLDKNRFQLDASGVAGFFGGDEAVNAMATVHIHQYRKFLGWYNSPGSYNVAKKYGQLARSRIWRGLFSGEKTEPTTLFGLNGGRGPVYTAFYSGTVMGEIGHIGSLLMEQCEELEKIEVKGGRRTYSVSVTIVNFKNEPDTEVPLELKKPKVTLLAFIPILFSIGSSVVCGVFQDWYCFSMILLGIITSGLSCLAIGSGRLFFTHAGAAKGAPIGDGFMKSRKGVVILRGSALKTDHELDSNSAYIGTCSILLLIQFLAQLLLIPQGSLFGQIMFLSTLAVSWLYNSFLSSLDRNKIQRELLMDNIWKQPIMNGYKFGNWTSMTVFALLAARPPNPRKLLNELIPNDTEVWIRWKEWVLNNREGAFDDADLSFKDLNPEESSLLSDFVTDTKIAYQGFLAAGRP